MESFGSFFKKLSGEGPLTLWGCSFLFFPIHVKRAPFNINLKLGWLIYKPSYSSFLIYYSQAGIRTAGRNNMLRYVDDTTLMAESEDTLKSLLMRMKEQSEKPGLKLNIKKTKIMASGLITSWWMEGEKVETVTDFVFWGSKITADGDCSHKIRRCLLLGRKDMTNLAY